MKERKGLKMRARTFEEGFYSFNVLVAGVAGYMINDKLAWRLTSQRRAGG